MRRRAAKSGLSLATLALTAAGLLLSVSGCSLLGAAPGQNLPPTSIQRLEYFPYQVKGYQNSYPSHTIVILMPTEQRSFVNARGFDHAPMGDNPAIGVVRGPDNDVIEQLYALPLAPLVQKAIARSSGEAGLTAILSKSSVYSPAKALGKDYVVQATIRQCWVTKQRGPNGDYGPTWATTAHFALDVAIYKPPFKVPFWQGVSIALYQDPPIGAFGLGPEDQTGIYAEPGEDLSVALTRSVAGIFDRQDLHALMVEDQISQH